VLQVRPATIDDAHVVADVYIRSWLAGYESLVDPVELEPVAAERAAHDWPCTINDSASRLGLGFVDGSPAGIAKVGPDPTEAVQGHWLDLLYVAPEFWGTGVASSLLRWSVDLTRAAGAPCLRLRVVAVQDRARRFYEREGWEYDREVPPSRNAFFSLLCMRSDLT
jgi:GNAT superfamily N-acetyltransferase